MNIEKIINLKQDASLSQKSLVHLLNQRGYKKVPNWISFFLRVHWEFSKNKVQGVHVKMLMNIFPLWYLGYQFNNEHELHLHYYTKGISFLDFFGVKKKWEEEIKNLQSIL